MISCPSQTFAMSAERFVLASVIELTVMKISLQKDLVWSGLISFLFSPQKVNPFFDLPA
jgi:hypothetical protein